MANVLDCNIVISEFKLQSRINFQFYTNTFRKVGNLLSPKLRVKYYQYCFSTNLILALNN